MPLQATLPLSVVNVPNDYFSMAGFEVTLHGRFWVTAEERQCRKTTKNILHLNALQRVRQG